jgi:tetratricopeptide (TPR) repeat protein
MFRKQPFFHSCPTEEFVLRKFLTFLVVVLFAHTGFADSRETLTCADTVSLLIGGISNQRISELARKQGTSFRIEQAQQKSILAAGADTALIQSLRTHHSATTDSKCSAAMWEAGGSAHRANYPHAEEIVRKLVDNNPQNAAIHLALGYIRQQQGDWNEAFDEYSTSKKLMPGLPEIHNRLAYVFYQSNDSNNAIAEARTALSIDPRNAEAHRMLGLGLYINDQYGIALNAFREALSREPDNADTHYDMAMTLNDKGDPQAAAEYRLAIKLRPAFWQAHNNLGILLHDAGELGEAIAEYQRAKQLAPQEPTVRNNLGNTYYDKGAYDSAVTEFHELFRLNPNWKGGHAGLSKVYLAKRDYQSAIPELKLAILDNPTGSAEHRVLGQVLLLTHEEQEGLRELRIAVELDPDSALAHRLYGTALFEAQKLNAASREFHEALRLEPSAENHYFLAACLMSMGRDGEALAELELASSLKPGQNLYRARKDELLKLMKGNNAQ